MYLFWQNYAPPSVLVELGGWSVHWYGLILVLAILSAYFYVRSRMIKKSVLSRAQVDDLFFYVIIGGLVGSRLGHVLFYNFSYYWREPQDIVKVWQGGLSIHGALLLAFLVLWWWSRKHQVSFWQLTDYLAPAVALGQAIGRWGNYFNQELYGRPSDSWWAIYIEPAKRVAGYEYYDLFMPAFFLESLLNLILFFILFRLSTEKNLNKGLLTGFYLLGYSLIRFFMEFIRIDPTPLVLGWRLPQLISSIILGLSVLIIFYLYKKPNSSGQY